VPNSKCDRVLLFLRQLRRTWEESKYKLTSPVRGSFWKIFMKSDRHSATISLEPICHPSGPSTAMLVVLECYFL
jgi:hypothetical protein